MVVIVPTCIGHRSTNATHSIRLHLLYYLRVVFEWVVMAFWAAAFVVMLLPKGKDYKNLFKRPPYGEWYAAVVLAAIEMYVFPSHRSLKFPGMLMRFTMKSAPSSSSLWSSSCRKNTSAIVSLTLTHTSPHPHYSPKTLT